MTSCASRERPRYECGTGSRECGTGSQPVRGRAAAALAGGGRVREPVPHGGAMTQLVLDVSHLEEGTNDSRSLLWWGNLGMLAIEGSMFMMALATYLYLKTANLDWPPSTVPKPELVLPTVNLMVLLLALVPAVISDRAAYRDDRRTALIAQ